MKSLNVTFQLSSLPSSLSLIVSAWKGKQLEFLNRHFINPSILIKRVLVLLLKLGFLHTVLHKVPLLKQRRRFLQCSSYFIIHGSMLASSKKMPTLTCQVSSQYEGCPSYESTLVHYNWCAKANHSVRRFKWIGCFLGSHSFHQLCILHSASTAFQLTGEGKKKKSLPILSIRPCLLLYKVLSQISTVVQILCPSKKNTSSQDGRRF